MEMFRLMFSNSALKWLSYGLVMLFQKIMLHHVVTCTLLKTYVRLFVQEHQKLQVMAHNLQHVGHVKARMFHV